MRNQPPSVEEKILRYREEINRRLREVCGKQKPEMLYDPMRYALLSGGKRLRPILLLLTCEAVGGDYRVALNAAIAVELLHNFTLIHDDVMDHDDTRRGLPTVHKRWGIDLAILAGDGLVALSYEYLLQTKFSPIHRLGSLFSQALLELCEGQVLDKKFESTEEVSLAQYFTMIEKKTAALLALCCELGASIGGASQSVVRTLREFGRNMGLAFQIQDDLLDIMAPEKELGKTWGSDIKRKKKTLLLIQAKKSVDSACRAEISTIMNKKEITTEDIYRMKEIFQKSGTLKYSQQLLQQHFQKAQSLLAVIQKNEKRELLKRLLETIMHRNN